MPYTREQIYTAIRKADQAGDAEAVRALGRQLRSMDEPEELDTSDLSASDAQRGLRRGEQVLRERTAGMTAQQRRIARERFDASPRIRALRDRADDFRLPTLRELGESTVNAGVGLVQSATGAYDMGTKLATMPQQLGVQGVLRGGGVVADMIDPRAGDTLRRAADIQQGASDMMTNATGVVEQAFPTQPGYGPARTTATVLGGLLIPGPKMAPRPIQAPRTAAPASEAAQVVREGERAGVRVMTTDVRPPRTFIGRNAQALGEKIPWAGTGGPRAVQQAQRVEAVRTLLRDTGGDDIVQLFDDTPAALDDVARSLTAQRSRELTRLTGRKKDVIARLSSAGEVPVKSTLQAIDDQIAMLTRRGTRPALEVVEELKGLRGSMQGKTLDQLEAIRADELSNAFTGNTLADIRAVGEKAIRAIYGPLRDDMGSFISAHGAKGDLTAWKGANERLAAMAGELDATAFRNVLKNAELTPEVVGRMLFSRDRSTVARLYSNLDAQGQARAQAAVIQRAFDKAISADQGLSVERFVNNLSQMGDSVGVVFQGDDLARVQGLAKVLNATRRAASASVAPPTGVQNTPIAGGFALGTLFGQAAIPVAAAGGMLARFYESVPVRNLLLKLGRTKPGTPQESKLMGGLMRLATATVATQGPKLARAANDALAASPSRAAASEQETD